MTLERPTDNLLAVWQALPRQDGALMPRRSALHITELAKILPRISLMCWASPYEMTIGLVGTKVADLWDRPTVGMNAFDLIPPAMRKNASQLYQTILKMPVGATVRERLRRPRRRPLHITSLYLPLADEDGTPRYIVGCSVASEDHQLPVLRDHVVTSHRQLAGLTFLDIGAGVPTVNFEMPSIHQMKTVQNLPYADRRGWWHRLTGGRPSPRPVTGQRPKPDASPTVIRKSE